MTKNPEMIDWLGHHQTFRLRKAAEAALKSKLTQLMSGCAVSTDPAVRGHLAQYRAQEALVKLLTEGDASAPSEPDRTA